MSAFRQYKTIFFSVSVQATDYEYSYYVFVLYV